jgi:hypothetical protein
MMSIGISYGEIAPQKTIIVITSEYKKKNTRLKYPYILWIYT